MLARYWKWLLLACAPFAIAAHFLHYGAVPIFLLSALAIIPLAALIGESTGHLSEHLGPSAGALINATFGNLAEMIIAVFAVRAGLLDVVKASLTGSILGNLLFVGGLSMLVGGWKRDAQKFNQLSVEASAGQMVVATIKLHVPEAPNELKLRVRQYCAERLASYKVPVKIRVADGPIHSQRFKRVRGAQASIEVRG